MSICSVAITIKVELDFRNFVQELLCLVQSTGLKNEIDGPPKQEDLQRHELEKLEDAAQMSMK